MAKKSVNEKSKVPTPPRASNGGRRKSKTKNDEHAKTNKHSDSSTLSTFMSIAVGIAAIGVVLTFLLSSDEGSCPYGYDDSSNTATGSSTTLLETSSPYTGAGCEIESWLSPAHSIAGFHILCVTNNGEDLSVRAFLKGQNISSTNAEFSSSSSWSSFRESAEDALNIKARDATKHELQQPWGVYTPDGEPLSSIEEVVHSGVVFVFEGGKWVWPGVEVGYERIVPNIPGIGPAVLKTLSMVPLVLEVQNFLLENECDEIIAASEPHMKSSVVTLMDHQKGKNDAKDNHWRTSSTFWLKQGRYRGLGSINDRTAAITRLPLNHQEDVQVLRYYKSEKYDSHNDYFDPKLYKSLDWIDQGYKNRLATLLWYMSDVPEGGQTVFLRSGGKPMPRSFKDCSYGLRVEPKKGNVILFYSMTADGELDPYSLHGACPVQKGVKWAANKWLWNKKFTPPRSVN